MPSRVVMVVDPDLPARESVARVLEQSAYQVLVAASGASALKLVKEKSVHLILLEFELPDMNGLALLRKLRRNPATTTMPLLMLCGRPSSENLVIRGLDQGADDFLFKPVSPAVLLA